MTTLVEDDVEQVALDWLGQLDWQIAHGTGISDDEREDHSDVILAGRLRDALGRLNPELPYEALEDAFRQLTDPEGASLEFRNRSFHRMLVEGVNVEYLDRDDSIRYDKARVVDFDDPDNNDFLAVNQFTVAENKNVRRADIVLFVNGLPLGIIELKSPTDPNADIWSAWNQLQTYKAELPTLFAMNEFLIISDGLEARVGTLTAGKEWFKPWRTIAGSELADGNRPQLEVAILGICYRRYFLSLMRDFIVFENDAQSIVKKMAGYHQFHSVLVAVRETIRASGMYESPSASTISEQGHYESGVDPGGGPGDCRIGVVWHTQGAGKSLTMAFYAGRMAREGAMANPTLVVLTDRNDLDDQLFATFSRCRDILHQPPVQAESRADLRELLSVVSGGLVFTTIQKFLPDAKGDQHPELSDRKNIVVIADEAHRSQYDFIDGFAAHMRDALPNASFIGFTGTPIEKQDANTRAVFGNYISIYDIQRSVDDRATVPIYYEGRLAKLTLDESERPNVDVEFEEVTEGEELEHKERLKSKWAQLEAVAGTEKRLALIAKDIVRHFENRLETMEGKAMVVCMSRRICVELYKELIKLRPEWHDDDDDDGEIKVVMTGSASDPVDWQVHIRNKSRREELARRFRNSEDKFKVVLVRDMWLTGFDAPSLHTMYVDKPMQGHNLMQAIARVNRVFRDKPGGLIVDYLGLAPQLARALATYTESRGKGEIVLDQSEALTVMLEKYEICRGLFHGFDWSMWTSGAPAERLGLLPRAQEHILAQEDGKERCINAVGDLSKAFALAVPSDDAMHIRDDVGFFQSVRAALSKQDSRDSGTQQDLDYAIRQIVSSAVASEDVVDIFSAAGLKKPDIAILSDEFLAEVRNMPHKNLAVELLQKLLKGEIAKKRRKNVVQARSFLEMLESTLIKYQNRSIQTAQVIEELIELANEMREASARGDELGLTEDELAFYDALADNDSAVEVLGDETLGDIAKELVDKVRNNVTIDWMVRENVRAQLRVLVKRILRKYGYPPDKQEKATQTVLEQAEVLSVEWAVLN